MITVNKVCCCELKWGVLTIAIIDLLFCGCGAGLSNWMRGSGIGKIFYILALVVLIAHIVGCILMIVSVFVANKFLVICYVITQLIRIIICLIFVIWIIIVIIGKEYANNQTDLIITLVIYILMLILGIWFWIIAYSWFRKLGGGTPVD